MILLSAGAGAQAVVVSTSTTVDAANTGWFDATGFHDASNTNYFAGATGHVDFHGGRLRAFFLFDISGLSGQVVSAELSARSYGGTGAPDVLTLFDVSTPISTLATTNNGATQVFDDLGSGTSYGANPVTDPTASTITVPLSATGVAALQAGLGGNFAIGGDYAPAATSEDDIFESTGAAPGPGANHPLSDVQLRVVTEPLPSTTVTTGAPAVTDVSTTANPATSSSGSTTIAPPLDSPEAVSVAAAPSASTVADRGTLPATGANDTHLLALGLVLILGGSLLASRRPESRVGRPD